MSNVSKIIIFRAVGKLIKQPVAPIMGFGMSIFFLIVYNAGIGGIGHLKEFGTAGYLAFIFPLSVISLAMGSSAGAGQTLNADMQSGYFKRLYLTPTNRLVLVIAPVIADTLSNLIFVSILLAIGAIMGIPFQFGLLSIVGILALSFLWSVTLCGFSAGVMIRTGQHQSAAIVTNAVFPLLFLSSTFLPRELITSKWLLAVSWFNPVTYLLEACRYLMAGTSSSSFFVWAMLLFSALTVAAVLFVVSSVRKIRV